MISDGVFPTREVFPPVLCTDSYVYVPPTYDMTFVCCFYTQYHHAASTCMVEARGAPFHSDYFVDMFVECSFFHHRVAVHICCSHCS